MQNNVFFDILYILNFPILYEMKSMSEFFPVKRYSSR